MRACSPILEGKAGRVLAIVQRRARISLMRRPSSMSKIRTNSGNARRRRLLSVLQRSEEGAGFVLLLAPRSRNDLIDGEAASVEIDVFPAKPYGSSRLKPVVTARVYRSGGGSPAGSDTDGFGNLPQSLQEIAESKMRSRNFRIFQIFINFFRHPASAQARGPRKGWRRTAIRHEQYANVEGPKTAELSPNKPKPKIVQVARYQ
jgi:hypothetical protein